MNKLAVSLFAGAAALVAGSAVQAAPLSPSAPALDNGIENVRMVCNDWGRCWREPGRRVFIDRSYDSYNYYGGPSYGYRHYHSGPGVQFNAPGVSVGIGSGGYYHGW